MFKRIFAWLCCVLPMGAGAVDISGDVIVTGESTDWQNAMSSGATIKIVQGNGINDSDDGATYGINFANDFVVGQPTDGTFSSVGSLYVMDNANQNKSFSINSVQTVSFGGVMQILDGWGLQIAGHVFSDNYTNAAVTVGSVNVGGASVLGLYNLKDVQVNGVVDVLAGATLNADTVGAFSAGNVNTSGIMNISASKLNQDSGAATSGNVSVAGLNVLAGTATVDAAGDFDVAGSVQNNAVLDISAGGQINIDGNVSNNVSTLTVRKGLLTVDGNMTNGSGTELVLSNLQGWYVSGQNSNGYSFVNSGDFEAVVSGKTDLEYGWDLSGMSADNVFSLTTGQLDLGTNNLIVNNTKSFQLNVTDGDVNLGEIVNGSGEKYLGVNVSGDLVVQSVLDQAQGVVSSENPMGFTTDIAAENVTINTTVNTVSGASAKIYAMDGLVVDGAISNLGGLTLGGATVQLQGVVNAGESAELIINGDGGTDGSVTVNGSFVNGSSANEYDASVSVSANTINFTGGLINYSGSFDIVGSQLNVGQLSALGGVVFVDTFGVSASGITVDGGTLNLDNSVANMIVTGRVDVAGDVVLGGTADIADNINIGAANFVLNASNDISVDNIDASKSGFSAQFISNDIEVGQGVNIANGSVVTFGNDAVNATSGLEIAGQMTVADGGVAEIYSNTTGVGALVNNGLIKAHGNSIVATNGDLNISGLVRFGNSATDIAGLSLLDTSLFVLQNESADKNIYLGGVSVDSGKTLYVESGQNISVANDITNVGTLIMDAVDNNVVSGAVTNYGAINVTAQNINLQDVVNNTSGTINLFTKIDSNSNVKTDLVTVNSISNSGSLKIAYFDSGSAVDLLTSTGLVENISGNMDLYAKQLDVAGLSVTGGTVNVYAPSVAVVQNDISVTGDVVQGGATGNLNLINTNKLVADNFIVTRDFDVSAGDVLYELNDSVKITGDLTVANGADAEFAVADIFSVNDLTNYGDTTITAYGGINVSGVVENNSGVLDLNSDLSDITVGALTAKYSGNVLLSGASITSDGMFYVDGILGQNTGNAVVDIKENSYVMNLANMSVGGIKQTGSLTINSSDIYVGGDIDADDLRFAANPVNNWMNVEIAGNVSGNVGFVGLEKMRITGDYTFNDNSYIHAAVLPYATGTQINTTDVNYWASVSLKNDDSFGKITNAPNAKPMIEVFGKLQSDLTLSGLGSADVSYLQDAQIGIDVFDVVDTDTAIWLLYADAGIYDFGTKIRNLNVKFCNEDGTICVPYFNNLDKDNPDGLPAYVSVRDTDDNSVADSLYIVFDNQFGGPIQVFGIQPIVGRDPMHTQSEFVAAGALDNMVAGQLEHKKFYNRTLIEVLPLVFADTNLSRVGTELYNRMENYAINPEPVTWTNFSGLFENFEIEQVAASVALNEHTAFRSFEDRMIDEFIWNRNRNLKKSWLDVDYGMFYQNTVNGHNTDGDRFSISGGFDWQESNTLILGLTGRVSHTLSKISHSLDLSYADINQLGYINSRVSDTNVGLGGYLMKILGEKYRMYGNVFMDVHVFDVERNQTFVDTIEGNGTAFSLISEFGLMHDILNQYIVGNAYARVGYNFGFDVKEKAGGDDYMRLKSDGYVVLIPGYSLTAQKRIYPSAWFQIRPYASIGVEYDVLGMPDDAQYKFAVATQYTDNDIEINPLWANIGGGIEMLSANGVQVGLDYRYQYNSDLQLHNIRLSGSYRF